MKGNKKIKKVKSFRENFTNKTWDCNQYNLVIEAYAHYDDNDHLKCIVALKKGREIIYPVTIINYYELYENESEA